MPSLATNLGTAAVVTIGRSLRAHQELAIYHYLSTFVLTFAVITLANIIYYCYIYPHVSHLRQIPTAQQAPVHKRFFKETRGPGVVGWMTSVPNNGLIRGFTFLNRELLIATNPETLKEILATDAYSWVKPPSYAELLSMIIGNGLVTLEGPAHKQQRKMLQPSFSYRHIQELYPTFWAKTKELVGSIQDDIRRIESDGIIDIQDWMGRTTLDIIGVAGFGMDFRAITDLSSQLVSDYRQMFVGDRSPGSLIAARVLPIKLIKYIPTRRLKAVWTSTRAISLFLQTRITERRAILEKSDQVLADKDILAVAMQAEAYTDAQLIDHSMTFLAAGQDTTSFALTMAIFQLSQDHALQDRVRLEIRRALPSPGVQDAIITSSDMEVLPWLTAVCNETLRLWPSVDATGRMSLHSDRMVAGTKIPKGTLIGIPMHAYHRYYPLWSATSYSASEWHPERWFENIEKGEMNLTGGATNSRSFMTFNKGARSCIGERFARGEMAVVLAGLIGKFEFTFNGASGKGKPLDNLDIMYDFTGSVLGGMWVHVKEVEGW
ncbi:MAG: hypothetical protein Q9160_001022 [Pyrenula sp. 1 TL-2023]